MRELIARYGCPFGTLAAEGTALLANAFRDPQLMTSQVRHLERWIDSLT